MNKNRIIPSLLLAGALSFVLMGASDCEDSAPAPDSDSSQSYQDDARVPVDDNVYRITGEVTGPVNDLTRQVEPAQGSLSGPTCVGTGGCYGGTTGTFSGPIQAGKSFIRLLVSESSPETKLAPVGDVTIIKTSDTKAAALVAGDVVTFACRRQYEALAAVRNNSTFDKDKVATYELDYCRLYSPVIEVKQ